MITELIINAIVLICEDKSNSTSNLLPEIGCLFLSFKLLIFKQENMFKMNRNYFRDV